MNNNSNIIDGEHMKASISQINNDCNLFVYDLFLFLFTA